MTTTIAANPEVARYLEAVRTHLATLADVDRAELLEDLEAHLNEVAAEDDGSLVQRLGDPAAFAEELVASAGLTTPDGPAGPQRRSRRSPRDVLAASSSWQAAQSTPAAQQVLAFLPELRPGWWILRAYLAVMILGAASRHAVDTFPWPSIADSTLVGLVMFGLASAASVWWGRRSDGDDRLRRLTVVMDVVLVLLAFQAFSSVRTLDNQRFVPVYEDRFGQLTGTNGESITNVFPYDADGRPLSGVWLYDQNGQPITLGSDDGSGSVSQQFPIDPRPPVPMTTSTVPPPTDPPPAPGPPPTG